LIKFILFITEKENIKYISAIKYNFQDIKVLKDGEEGTICL